MSGTPSSSAARQSWMSVLRGLYATAAPYGLVMALAFVCYWRVWTFGFVYVDDDRLIVDEQLELLGPGAYWRGFQRPYFRRGASDHSFYRPLVTTSYVIDARLGGKSAHQYHRSNALLHVGISALVLCWLQSRGYRRGSDLFAALAFAVHPLTVEAVAWIAGRPDQLMTAFALLSWIFHRRAAQRRSIGIILLHHSTWFLALLSKESAIVLPVVLLLEDRILRGKAWRDAAPPRRLLGWALVLVAYWIARATALDGAPGLASLGLPSDLLSNLASNAPTLVLNLGKILLPIQHSPLATPEDTWLWPGLLGVLTILVLWTRDVARQSIAWALLSYVLLMLPNLLAPAKLTLETRLYLPMIPVLGVVPSLIEHLSWSRQQLGLVGALILTVLAGSSVDYLQAFRDRPSFAAAAVLASPRLALAHKNMGLTYHAAGRLDQAEREYRAAIALDPEEPMAHGNLGAILGSRKHFIEAEREFRQELLLNPHYAPAHHNLAALLQAKGLYDEAAVHWESSLQDQRSDVTAARHLFAYYSARHDPKALRYRQLLESLATKRPDASGLR